MGNSKKLSKSETETETETEDAKQASFKAWAVAQGITTNGVDYCKIPNSGLGIVAQRRLEVITHEFIFTRTIRSDSFIRLARSWLMSHSRL